MPISVMFADLIQFPLSALADGRHVRAGVALIGLGALIENLV
jgi:hypothetical protein|tara:strand:- start:266 stop:391 length:126 start_codon:yes stop_codon:yes gene_type:complete